MQEHQVTLLDIDAFPTISTGFVFRTERIAAHSIHLVGHDNVVLGAST